MKYSQLVNFIQRYFGRDKFETALHEVVGLQVNKERLDIYEKLLIYCPELSDKSKNYINGKIASNKDMIVKREKLIASHAMLLEKEVKKTAPRELDDYLEGRVRETLETNYGRIAAREAWNTVAEVAIPRNTALRADDHVTVTMTNDTYEAPIGEPAYQVNVPHGFEVRDGALFQTPQRRPLPVGPQLANGAEQIAVEEALAHLRNMTQVLPRQWTVRCRDYYIVIDTDTATVLQRYYR